MNYNYTWLSPVCQVKFALYIHTTLTYNYWSRYLSSLSKLFIPSLSQQNKSISKYSSSNTTPLQDTQAYVICVPCNLISNGLFFFRRFVQHVNNQPVKEGKPWSVNYLVIRPQVRCFPWVLAVCHSVVLQKNNNKKLKLSTEQKKRNLEENCHPLTQ